MMRWVVRLVGAMVGLAALLGTGFLLKTFGLKDTKHERFREGTMASGAIRTELGRDCILRVDPAPGFEEQVVVVVKYQDVPNEPAVRKELVRNTNMVVRRIVHHVRDLKILFDDEPEVFPAWDSGVAVGETPEPVVGDYMVPVPIPRTPPTTPIAAAAIGPVDAAAVVKPPPPRPATKMGTVTLVTFPDADVFRGKEKLGRTPLFNAELPVGTHMLTLVGDDGARHRLSIPVKVGKNKPLKMNLADLPAK